MWKPDFSCCGARWVQIEGCTRDGADKSKLIIHDVKGHFVTSASEDVGKQQTDDLRITKLAPITGEGAGRYAYCKLNGEFVPSGRMIPVPETTI